MRILPSLTLAALLPAAAFPQSITSATPASSTSAPVFEAADVHVSPKSINSPPFMSGGVLRGARFDIHKATLVDLISNAYGIDGDYVLGGPSWLENDRFDILAKAPAGTTPEDAKLMLQALLADRFKLVLHHDTKPMPGFVLSVGKGKPKLKDADASAAPGCQGQPQQPKENGVSNAFVVCHSQTMDQLAKFLPQAAGAYVNNNVVNKTGLDGSFDFTIEWTGRALLQRAGADGITLFDAIDKQLGLKLEQQPVPTPILLVDSANQTPSPNPPGVSTSLPPAPPARFDVAVIKPTPPDFQGMRLQVQPSGQVNIAGVPLGLIVQQIFFMSPEMIIGAPKFMDTDRWDITAKISTDATRGNAPAVDTDSLFQMVLALLEDRFQLKTHYEEQTVSGYVITAVKPKLQKADPTGRTGCKEPSPGTTDAKDPRLANPVLNRYLVCHNMTIAQFAEQLPYLANGYAHSPVVDATGLTDPYDFILSFSAAQFVNGSNPGQPGAPGAAGGAAAEPNGAISLPEAVSRQLGLKMEMQKHKAQVLVIDHIEQKPTDN